MGINVSIVAGSTESESKVNASGSVQHVISDEERTTFGLSDQQLKNAVGKYFGKVPNDAYLHSPTPWDDLYKRYGWAQVQTVLGVQDAQVLGLTSEPIILKTQEFVNDSSQEGRFNVGITDSVSETATSSWTTGGTLTVSQKFTYDVKFLGAGGGGETGLSYSQSWGVGGQESKSVTVGSNSGVSVTLKPHQSIVVELDASRGVLKVQLAYNAYLTGYTAINYNPTFKGHHFWALGIGDVMRSAGISNSVKSTEDIEIGYYSNAKIVIKDAETGTVQATHRLGDMAIPGDVDSHKLLVGAAS